MNAADRQILNCLVAKRRTNDAVAQFLQRVRAGQSPTPSQADSIAQFWLCTTEAMGTLWANVVHYKRMWKAKTPWRKAIAARLVSAAHWIILSLSTDVGVDILRVAEIFSVASDPEFVVEALEPSLAGELQLFARGLSGEVGEASASRFLSAATSGVANMLETVSMRIPTHSPAFLAATARQICENSALLHAILEANYTASFRRET